MCQIIVIDKGKKEITNPKEFKNHFGFLPLLDEFYSSLELDCCLCQCDIDKTFKNKNIDYWYDNIDSYFVGKLNEIDKGNQSCQN